LEPLSPAERLAAQQRDHEKLQRERPLTELAEARSKARGEAVMKRPVGCPCMLLAPRASPLLSQPLHALPLGHPHRVSEDGKWVREGCFSD